MRKVFGVVCIIGSVLLYIKANDVAGSLASRVRHVFAGVPVDGAVNLYLAATVSGLLGLVLVFWKAR